MKRELTWCVGLLLVMASGDDAFDWYHGWTRALVGGAAFFTGAMLLALQRRDP